MDVFERVMMCLILASLASLAAAIVKLSRALMHDFDGRLRRLEGRDSGG